MSLSHEQLPLYERKAEFFKALAHPIRIRALELLVAADEVSVAELQRELDLEASHLSQHLSVLRRYGVVTSQRRASNVFYRVSSPTVAALLSTARALLGEMLAVSGGALDTFRDLPEVPVQGAPMRQDVAS